MPPRRPPPSFSSSIGSLLNRAQDTASAAAHAKLAPHLWAHRGRLGDEAFWGELVGSVDYLLSIAPVSEGSGREGGGGVNWARRRAERARMRQGDFFFPSRGPTPSQLPLRQGRRHARSPDAKT
jgi:hypothetical protein